MKKLLASSLIVLFCSCSMSPCEQFIDVASYFAMFYMACDADAVENVFEKEINFCGTDRHYSDKIKNYLEHTTISDAAKKGMCDKDITKQVYEKVSSIFKVTKFDK